MQTNSNGRSPRFALRIAGVLSVATLLVASTVCNAQARTDAMPASPAPNAPPPPVVGAAPLAPPPEAARTAPPPSVAPLAEPGAEAGPLVTADATVTRFLTNPDGNVDGFLTGDGTFVHFPPHMSAQLTSTIHTGDSVQISGWRDAGGSLKAQRITNTRTGQQVVDQPPLPGTQPLPRELRGAGLSQLAAQGKVAHVTTAPRGEPDGVILADGTVIKLTPPVAQQFPTLVQTGAMVSAQGYGTRNQYGTALQATAFGSPGKLTRLYDRGPSTF